MRKTEIHIEFWFRKPRGKGTSWQK